MHDEVAAVLRGERQYVVVCGNALAVLPGFGDGVVDAVVTDPPFGKGFHYGDVAERPTARWRSPKPSRFKGIKVSGDVRPDVRSVEGICHAVKEGGAVYLFSQWMVEPAWLAEISRCGLKVRNRLVWAKPFHGAGDLLTTYGPQHETIIFASRGRHVLNEPRDGDVWVEPVGPNGCFRKGLVHPNEKPAALLAWLVRKSTSPGDLVLDPFCGSGTTGLACLMTGRRFVGVEIDPAYAALARRRLEEASNNVGLFAGLPRTPDLFAPAPEGPTP